jgi:GT2 family glycosyltransferase
MTMPGSEKASGDGSVDVPPMRISVVIPTYQRERVLLETIDYLLELEPGPAEIVIVDQTRDHEPDTQLALAELETAGRICWIRLSQPSITHAMNVGLQKARSEIVLFLDDDIIPGADLISSHTRAHATRDCDIVAGQVLQPGETPVTDEQSTKGFSFRSNRGQFITELMGGNFSIKRELALALGGFDENFVHVAYRFEAEFAARARAADERIWFEPAASIHHLKSKSGGTRAYGDHLTTVKPSHAVGEYYYFLRGSQVRRRMLKVLARPLRAIRTRHHLSHPWWIPGTLFAEGWGFCWAVALAARGPKLLRGERGRGTGRRPGTGD